MSNYKKKWINILIIFLIIVFAIGWIVLYFHEVRTKKIELKQQELLTNGFSYFLDKDFNQDDDNLVSGWLLVPGETVNTCTIDVILKDKNSMEAYILPTQVEKREDVTAFMDDGNNYDYSGFEALIDGVELNKKYVLCFKVEINNVTYYFNTQQEITL